MTGPYGPIDPNSQHQMWSRWIFGVEASPDKLPPVQECIDNARRFFVKAFHSSVGRVRCDQQGTYYVFVLEVEGPPAHDREFVAVVKKTFIRQFMYQGFGFGSTLKKFDVGVLAGDKQDGKPPDQLIVIPQIPVN